MYMDIYIFFQLMTYVSYSLFTTATVFGLFLNLAVKIDLSAFL